MAIDDRHHFGRSDKWPGRRHIERGGPLLSDSGRVVLDLDLTLVAGANARITNGLTLNRTATLNGSGEGTTLNFDGTQTLGGSGQLVFVGFPRTLVQPLNGALTIRPGLTVRGGSGTIANASNPLTVQGSIVANGLGSIIHLLGNPFTNLGVTTQVNGGKIVNGP